MVATCAADGTVRLWALPGLVTDEPGEALRRAQLITGLSLDDNGTVRVTSPAAWRVARVGGLEVRLQTDRGPTPPDGPSRAAP